MSATIAQLLAELARLDVKLWVEGGKLRLNAPQGTLSAELKAQLSARKQELIDFFSQGDAAMAQRALAPRPAGEPAPLTHGQERIWSLSRLEPGSSVYNVPTVFQLAGALDVQALERAISAVVGRHDSLRTVFTGNDTQDARQNVLASQPVALPVTQAGRDLAKLPPQQARRALQQLLQREVRKPFDLQQGPLWRVRLFRLKADQHVLAFTMHHIVFDGVSKAIFLEELGAAYRAARAGEAAPQDKPALQFADYAAWQRAHLDEAALERQLGFWREQLAGDIPPLATPNDKPRQAGKGGAASVNFAVPPALTASLQALAAAEKAPLFAVLMAAFNVLLHGYTGQQDQLLVSPMASRDRAEIERMVGYFNNIVVMRADLAGNPSLRELVGQLRRKALAAFDNQFLPLQRVAQLPNLVRTPLTRGMFSFQDASSRKLDLGDGLGARPLSVRKDAADFDLALYTELEDGRITGVLDVNADIFSGERVKLLLQRYLQVLEIAAREPDRKLADFPAYGRPMAEIEALLARHPQIEQAVAEVDAHTGRLNAWLVLNEHDVPSLDAIRVYAAANLPDYRVPAAFVPVDEMPLRPDGSVDRAALPVPGGGRSRLGTEYRAPRSPLEQELAAIWKRVLWLDHDVGIDDRFRELGGHSLLSVQMVVEIEKALGRTVPARALAALNTVAELAQAMEQPQSDADADGRSEVLPDDIYHGLRSHTASWEGHRTSAGSVMVGLNTGGAKQAIFWCLQRYQELQQLAKYLGPEQPVYGMRSGNRVMVKTQENIELLAAHYVGEILATQPQGPYIIGGNCQAALIAFQIARQLRARGHEITLLVMQEKFAPYAYDSPVALLFGDRSVYNPYLYFRDPQQGWHKYYSGPVAMQQVQGEHGQFFREPNVQVLTAAISKFVQAAQAGTLQDAPGRTGADRQVLPAEGYRAELSATAPAQAGAGQSLPVRVKIINRSAVDWRPSQHSGLFVANRWLDDQGRVRSCLDGRAPLPEGLTAGAQTELVLEVKAPAQAGAWKLEIDLVDEGVAWFQEMGSVPCQIELKLT